MEHAQVFLLLLFPKQYRLTTIRIAFIDVEVAWIYRRKLSKSIGYRKLLWLHFCKKDLHICDF